MDPFEQIRDAWLILADEDFPSSLLPDLAGPERRVPRGAMREARAAVDTPRPCKSGHMARRSQFSAMRGMRDGLHPYCRTCRSAQQRAWRRERRDAA